MSGSARSSSYDPYGFEIPSFAAAEVARSKSLDAIATTCEHSPRCIAGITFLIAISAAPRTPHRTFAFIFFRRVSKKIGACHASDVSVAVRPKCNRGPSRPDLLNDRVCSVLLATIMYSR